MSDQNKWICQQSCKRGASKLYLLDEQLVGALRLRAPSFIVRSLVRSRLNGLDNQYFSCYFAYTRKIMSLKSASHSQYCPKFNGNGSTPSYPKLSHQTSETTTMQTRLLDNGTTATSTDKYQVVDTSGSCSKCGRYRHVFSLYGLCAALSTVLILTATMTFFHLQEIHDKISFIINFPRRTNLVTIL